MKKWEISVLAGFLFCILISFCGFSKQCEAVSDEVLRLHILANSNSAHDQELKLLVRDEILKRSENLFENAQSKQQAQKICEKNISAIKAAALEALRKNGCYYNVSVRVGKSNFNTRTYQTVTLPAGVYDSLIIEIGEAQGKNWWCVMFPQMCLPAADGCEQLDGVLSEGQMEIVCGGEKYKLGFKCVELYEQLKQTLGQR